MDIFNLYSRSKILKAARVDRGTERQMRSFIDRFIYSIALIGPLMTVPQVVKIWSTKSASDLSLVTWIAYTVTTVFWFLYGIIHNDKPLIFINIAWIIVIAVLITGILIYS